MFTAKYNSNTKELVIYKNNKQCAVKTEHNLIFSPNFVFSIEEICIMLDMEKSFS